jgi:hypothetical protein
MLAAETSQMGCTLFGKTGDCTLAVSIAILSVVVSGFLN